MFSVTRKIEYLNCNRVKRYNILLLFSFYPKIILICRKLAYIIQDINVVFYIFNTINKLLLNFRR